MNDHSIPDSACHYIFVRLSLAPMRYHSAPLYMGAYLGLEADLGLCYNGVRVFAKIFRFAYCKASSKSLYFLTPVRGSLPSLYRICVFAGSIRRSDPSS